jgi:hypothetical protein
MTSYWFESPTANDTAMLEVTRDGFVRTLSGIVGSGLAGC